MAPDSAHDDQDVTPSRRAPWIRASIGAVLSLVLLPYAFGRTTLIWMLVGRPEGPFFVLWVLISSAIFLLVWRMGPELRPRAIATRFAVGLVIAWCLGNGALILLKAGDLIPPFLV